MLIFAITSISFCFLMTVFFSKANSAATGAGIIWFVTYSPFFFLQLRYATLTRTDKLISCLFSNTAMAFASQLMSMFEGSSKTRIIIDCITAAQNVTSIFRLQAKGFNGRI